MLGRAARPRDLIGLEIDTALVHALTQGWAGTKPLRRPHLENIQIIGYSSPGVKYYTSHIPQKYAKPINAFYQEVFNDWLNLHRLCLFATEVVSDKGKIKKVYRNKDAKTPQECLVLLDKTGLVSFKSTTMLQSLLDKGREKTDLQAAREMQRAKADLFALFNRPGRQNPAGLG